MWEIAIKQGLGKLAIPADYLEVLRQQGFAELPVSWEHGRHITNLPPHNRDPFFDRMLIAQARIEDLVLLTEDERIKKHDVRVM